MGSRFRESRRRDPEASLGMMLVAPSVFLIGGLVVIPMIYCVYLSFHRLNLLLRRATFTGLGNYSSLAQSPEFWGSMLRTLYFAATSIAVQMVLGVAIALLLQQSFRGRWLARGLIILPWSIPTIVNATLWLWIYHPTSGVLNGVLRHLGIIQKNVVWLGTPWLAMNSIIVADTWRMAPLYVILFLAALQTIPDELYEAAMVDGAGAVQRFWKVTWPYLVPTALVVLVLRTMDTFRVFDIIYIMTKGGPANGTMVVTYLAYLTSFKFLKFGEGASLSVLIALTIIAVSVLYYKLLQPGDLA